MSAGPLGEIAFGRYFSLLRQLLPCGMDFYVCNLAGSVLAADSANAAHIPSARIRVGNARKHAVSDAPSRLAIDKSHDGITYVMDLRTPAGEIAGLLVGVRSDGSALAGAQSDDAVDAAFMSVTDCIEKEYRLTAELNTMAHELAGRYEELNLVYDADDSASIEDEGITLKQLIENYVDYLDVDMAALIYPDKDRILCATGKRDPVHEPYEIIRQLSRDYLPQARAGGDCLLVNDINDRRRDELSLEMPYKILSCPVKNARGEVDGILICLNHIYRTDFYNSDRNLLSVMARKVAKITQSNYDALTGLLNQHAFETVLERALDDARNYGLFHCLLNIDIDQLQILNEFHGREAGDHIIKSVGELLRRKLRSTDTVSYLSEGRYGVLLEKCNFEEGMRVARTLRDHVAQSRVSWDSTPLDLQISVGVTVVEPHIRDAGDAMEAAELARIAAKEQGRGQIQAFRPDDNDLLTRRGHMHCAARIQKALRENRFRLYCQTMRPADGGGEQYHLEVLLRLVGEDGAMVSPDMFIPSAEQFNLMPSIDRWVVDATLSSLAAAGIANSRGEGVVSINLSGQSLADVDLADYIAGKIRQYNIASDCLCFEVTETAAISNKGAAVEIIEDIKAIGCQFALDDFGTGLSSFSYLKEMPVDYVKIDGSFVRQILDDQVSHAMVASIIQIGHVMGLKTVAEYVENDAIAQRLMQMGVDYLQGYAIDRPQPLTDYLSGMCDMTSVQAG